MLSFCSRLRCRSWFSDWVLRFRDAVVESFSVTVVTFGAQAIRVCIGVTLKPKP